MKRSNRRFARSLHNHDLPREPPPLDTARLLLEPRGAQHASRLFVALRDAAVYRFVPQEAPDSTEALEARYRRVAAGPAPAGERWWNWAAILRDPVDVAIGTVELTFVEGGRKALLAYLFGPRWWGRGFAYEACRSVCDYVREHTSVRRIEASLDTRNVRSRALVERLGFACERRVNNADSFKGSSSDEFEYRLTLVKDDDG